MHSGANGTPRRALTVDYCSRTELDAKDPAWWQGVLGIVPFGAAPAFTSSHDIPVAPVALELLGDGNVAFEVWRLDDTLHSGRAGHVHYRAGGAALFGAVVIPESDLAEVAGDGAAALDLATRRAYSEIFAALKPLGYPHLLRVWNYLGSINHEDAFGERYRQFNSARRAAFLRSARVVEGDVPAACALGSGPGSPLVVYFLASSSSARPIENPRQVSAYRYPSEYGPHSPTFSRAAIASAGIGQQLFISGTASILGHRSVHVGDAAAQAREVTNNILALIDAANDAAGSAAYSAGALKYKAYVRNPRDLPAIEAEFSKGLRAAHPIVYLQADICRSELLVEIEGVGGPASIGGARPS